MQTRGPVGIVDGHIPVARVRELEQQLPALTRGEGVLDCAFSHYQEVPADQVPAIVAEARARREVEAAK